MLYQIVLDTCVQSQLIDAPNLIKKIAYVEITTGKTELQQAISIAVGYLQ